MAYLASLSLTSGLRAGLLATLGVAAGLAVHAVVAALGAGPLIERSPLLYETLRWAGVAYLLFLAWEGWRDAAENSPARTPDSDQRRRLFVRGFLSNVLNPKSILFFVSVVPGFIQIGTTSVSAQFAFLGSIYVAVATAVHATIVLLAGQLRPWLIAGTRRKFLRRVLARTLALVALWLAWNTRR